MATRQVSTTQQLVDEHLHLNEVLASVRQTVRDRRAAQQVVVATLRELTQRILDHFEHEEVGGYFAAATDADPRLGERVHALLLEHPKMAEQLFVLQQCAVRDSRLDQWWPELAARLEEFLDTFAAHEAAENALLQEAYSDDIGAED